MIPSQQIQRHCYLALSMLILMVAQPLLVNADNGMDGLTLMEKVYERHKQFPYVYEEHSMVMEDRKGERDTRRARLYTRLFDDEGMKFLLLFDYPEDIRGVAVLAERDQNGSVKKYVYLPALGEVMLESAGNATAINFLGTDFTVESLTGEDLGNYRYLRQEDQEMYGIKFYVVDVFSITTADEQAMRRHYIRQDNLYITLTHHFDRRGRVERVQSHHDLHAVDGDMWRADMILMMDKRENHQSLIKISKRVFSRDYVPLEVFSPDWLYRNYPHEPPVVEEDDELITLLREAMAE